MEFKDSIDPVNFTVSIDVTLGTFGTGNEGSTSGGLAAANVELSEPGRASSQNNVTNNISISADRDLILVGDRNAFVQRFTKQNLQMLIKTQHGIPNILVK